jgi:murein DD-endopeptidase MepM/ murein hydrolase activator NlpD
MKSLLVYLLALLNSSKVPHVIVSDSLPTYPKQDFRSPVDIPITLAGNFGEPRKLHFHTGIDIRTNQMEGLNIYAVADGYVSRINVSGTGYGKALYIKHKNGYTSVYAHLQRFSEKIEKRLQQEQYARQSFSVDFSLSSQDIEVTQGEIIALSGNTGGSGGPHLHFEIRDSLDRPVNPFHFGYTIPDNKPPSIAFLKFYPQDERRFYSSGYRVRPVPSKPNHLIVPQIIQLNAHRVSLSVNTWDVMDNSSNHVGIYGIRLWVDSLKTFEFNMDRMAFSDKRYVLSHLDYPIFMNEGKRSFHKCFTEPANFCPIYSHALNSGIIDLSDGKIKTVKIEVYDFFGNTTFCQFQIKMNDSVQIFKKQNLSYTQIFSPFQLNEFSTDDVSLSIPPKIIFDTLLFRYKKMSAPTPQFFSPIHQLHNPSAILFDFASLSIKLSKSLPSGTEDKAVIVWKNETGNWVSKGGKLENGFISTKIRELGEFSIQIDTTPPRIVPINISPNKNMRSLKNIMLTITDNLSGIKDFATYIDHQWVITEYDAKTNRLIHYLNPQLPPGVHLFSVVITDERNNQATYSVKFNM